jgi:hypothetical protein
MNLFWVETYTYTRAQMSYLWQHYSSVIGATTGITSGVVGFFDLIKGGFSFIGVVAGGTLAAWALYDKIRKTINDHREGR